jgi:hypothetical protein
MDCGQGISRRRAPGLLLACFRVALQLLISAYKHASMFIHHQGVNGECGWFLVYLTYNSAASPGASKGRLFAIHRSAS